MIGITDWGAYVATHRMPASLFANRRTEGGPERSLAWADEDSITMGVEAARRCLRQRPRDAIDLLVFATTTHAFDEKQGAALMAAVLGLPAGVRTVDIGNSLRCGAQALLLAHDSVKAGRARSALVVIADSRMGAPGSDLERSGGDAAVAFLIGGVDVVAGIIGHVSQSQEIIDVWRRNGDRFVHGWEDRFTTQFGYLEPAAIAARALIAEHGESGERRWAASAPGARAHATLARAIRLGANQMVPALFDRIGFCGAAHAPLLLAGALDQAKAGQEIAMLVHGDGAEALLFRVETARNSKAVADTIAHRIPVTSLAAYRRARELDASEYPPVDDQGISATVHFRERAEDLSLEGQRCDCGEPQFPKGRVCIRCGKKDQFRTEAFAERSGTLVTYTLDAFFPSPTPPTAVGVVQVEQGPRIYMQITELPEKEPALGMRVRFAFRRIHQVGRRPNYFWKAVPEGSQA